MKKDAPKIKLKSYILTILVLLIITVFLLKTADIKKPQEQKPAPKDAVSAVVTLNPQTNGYDPKILIVDFKKESKGEFFLKQIHLRVLPDFNGELLLFRGDKNIGVFQKTQNNNNTEYQMDDLLEPLENARYIIKSDSDLKIDRVQLRYAAKDGDLQDINLTRFLDDNWQRYRKEITATTGEFLDKNPQFNSKSDGIILGPGAYTFQSNVIIPNSTTLTIMPGTTLRFMPKTALISYGGIIAKGLQKSPIVFTSATDQPWGHVAVLNTQDKENIFENVTVENSQPQTVNGTIFTGALSAHFTKITIKNSTFRNNFEDDGANLKYSQVTVVNNQFLNNHFDGLDLDVSTGIVQGNLFRGNGNDGVDLSFNKAEVFENVASANGDKCISVGEASTAPVKNNIISNCPVGIAVKDESEIIIENNTISTNEKAIYAYNKKPLFGPCKAYLVNNHLQQNQVDKLEEDNCKIITK